VSAGWRGRGRGRGKRGQRVTTTLGAGTLSLTGTQGLRRRSLLLSCPILACHHRYLGLRYHAWQHLARSLCTWNPDRAHGMAHGSRLMAHGSWLQCQVLTGLCVARVASAPAASPHTFHGKLPIIQGRARRLVAFLSLNPPILDPRPSALDPQPPA
jgi:hypothetical protein